MTTPGYTRNDVLTWAAALAVLLLILYLHLLAALLSGLLVFELIGLMVPLLRLRNLSTRGARLLAVALIAGAVISVLIAFGFSATTFIRGSHESIPVLLQRMAEILEDSRAQLPAWIMEYVPDDAEELRKAIVEWLRGHSASLQLAGASFGRGLGHALVGMIIGVLLSLHLAGEAPETKPLAKLIYERAVLLSGAFRRVVFAQVIISAINTVFTALYLIVLLPAFGVDLPLAKTLIILTFFAGLLPILGNLMSNAIIFIVSLSHSLLIAVASLVYLVVIHKLEYFLNARIVGSRIHARAWEMLLAMLIMEAGFGLAGVIAAPIYYAYFKSELETKGLL